VNSSSQAPPLRTGRHESRPRHFTRLDDTARSAGGPCRPVATDGLVKGWSTGAALREHAVRRAPRERPARAARRKQTERAIHNAPLTSRGTRRSRSALTDLCPDGGARECRGAPQTRASSCKAMRVPQGTRPIRLPASPTPTTLISHTRRGSSRATFRLPISLALFEQHERKPIGSSSSAGARSRSSPSG
jgi:hypothetical protein